MVLDYWLRQCNRLCLCVRFPRAWLNFFQRKEAASAIEYAILIAIVSLVIVTAGTALGPQITNVFAKITAQLTGT